MSECPNWGEATAGAITDARVEVVAWNGRGFPPAGTVCNILSGGIVLKDATITYMSDTVYCYRNSVDGKEYAEKLSCVRFSMDRSDRDYWVEDTLVECEDKEVLKKYLMRYCDEVINTGTKGELNELSI